MAEKLENIFESGDKVLFIPEKKVYDFGHMGATGKAVIYKESERSMQDSYAVELKQLMRLKK